MGSGSGNREDVIGHSLDRSSRDWWLKYRGLWWLLCACVWFPVLSLAVAMGWNALAALGLISAGPVT